MKKGTKNVVYLSLLSLVIAPCLSAKNQKYHCKNQQSRSLSAPMMVGNTEDTNKGWTTSSLVTIGEEGTNGFNFNQENFNYNPIGDFDGIGPVPNNNKYVFDAFVNNEIFAGFGLPYTLANGTLMTGARVSKWTLGSKYFDVKEGGLAFNTIIDREGIVVTDPQQLNKAREESAQLARDLGAGYYYDGGYSRFCSGNAMEPCQGVADRLYMAGEEVPQGQATFIDPCSFTSYIAPMLGQFSFENAVPMENFGSKKVALLIGNDESFTELTPLILYLGERGATTEPTDAYQPAEFLVRNGFGVGKLFVWVANDPAITSDADFGGTGNSIKGKFIQIPHYNPSLANTPGYDNLGFLKGTSLEDALLGNFGPFVDQAFERGAYQFVRIEDLCANPQQPRKAAFAETGSVGTDVPYGRLYTIKFSKANEHKFKKPLSEITEISATLEILYDPADGGNGQVVDPNDGIRNPDNVAWASDGYIYICEDMLDESYCENGKLPSIWQVNPHSGSISRILEIDYSAVPAGQAVVPPPTCLDWEPSGVVDVSDIAYNPNHRTLLLLDVMAHSLYDSNPPGLFDTGNLYEGGQLLLAKGPACDKDELTKEPKLAYARTAMKTLKVDRAPKSREEQVREKLAEVFRDKEKLEAAVAAFLAKYPEA